MQGADALPSDGTQWSDGDGDGYGDNALGSQPDQCPTTPGNSTRAWLPDPENPQQNTELPSHGCEDKDGDGWADASESNGMDTVKGEYLDIDRDGVGANSDYNDNDARIQSEQDHCNLDFTDVRDVCQGWRTPAYAQYVADQIAANQTPMTFSSWNSTGNDDSTSASGEEWYQSEAMNDALVYGGMIFGGLTVVIIIVSMLMGRRKASTESKKYGGALSSSAAMSEALEGTAGSSATGGIDSDSLWDDEVKPLDIEEKQDLAIDSGDLAAEESTSEVMSDVEDAAMDEPETPAEEPASEVPSQAPSEAPPLPSSGLPEGWTMEQWKWYGHEYLAKYGKD